MEDGGWGEERRRKNYIAALKTTASPSYLAPSALPEPEESGEGGLGRGVRLSEANKEENRGRGRAATQEQYVHIRGKKRTGLQLGDNLNTEEAKWKLDEKREEGSRGRAPPHSRGSKAKKLLLV